MEQTIKKTLMTSKERCKGCGICVAFCPKQVLTLDNQKVLVINAESCIYCGMCEQRCPDYAVWIEEEGRINE